MGPVADAPASVYATAFLAGLIRRGVTDVVVCPGSRSQALALAAARFERAGLLNLHVRIDERSAGFLALGLAVESGVPAAVITTSGTAVANLHPAVLEAAHAGVPLLVVSADRPHELRGVGANQTTRQAGIFGDVVPHSWDVTAPSGDPAEEQAADALAAEVLAEIRGPRHVNIGFREPLSSPVRLPDVEPGEWAPPAPVAGETLTLELRPGTVVVAGADAGEDAERIARELGAPLLAEVSSGARFGPQLVAAYRELLGAAGFGDRVERVIVFGHPTLSREVPAIIERAGVETIVVRGAGLDAYNPGHRAARIVDHVEVAPGPDPDPSWARRWVHTSRTQLEADANPDAAPLSSITKDYAERAAFAREQLSRMRAPVTRRALVEAVWASSWPHDRLVVGASRLIRELDKVATGRRIRVHANRGLAGIDGTIATATGIALASQRDETRPGITRVLMGDLTLLHDVGSLLGGAGEEWPRLQLIVGNDHGGTIFDGLEVARSADPALADRVLLTPQDVDLASLAAAYGWEHRLVTEAGQLDGALTASAGRILIEVALAR